MTTEGVVVPREPTEKMLQAACDAEHLPLAMWDRMRAIYAATQKEEA